MLWRYAFLKIKFFMIPSPRRAAVKDLVDLYVSVAT